MGFSPTGKVSVKERKEKEKERKISCIYNSFINTQTHTYPDTHQKKKIYKKRE